MSSAANIAALPHSGPKGRTIVVVSLILFGLITSVPFPPPDPVTAPLASSVIAPWSPIAGSLTAIDGQKPHLKPAHATPFLTIMPDPSASPHVRVLLTFRQIWPLTPALFGLTLPARVQADL